VYCDYAGCREHRGTLSKLGKMTQTTITVEVCCADDDVAMDRLPTNDSVPHYPYLPPCTVADYPTTDKSHLSLQTLPLQQNDHVLE